LYGEFINAVIAFILVAVAIYFFVVVPMTRFGPKAEVTTKDCPACLSEIPIAARRCKYCTTDLPATA
jgi:large conductance mechanosensitive channel